MSNKYVMAIDCGTTGLKAALVDFDGNIICEANKDIPLLRQQPGWAEQEPELLWNILSSGSRECIINSGISKETVKAIVFVASWKSVILLDKDGAVLRNSIIWNDSRATEQADRLNEAFGEVICAGQEYWPRLMWVKENEPELWEKADKITGSNTFFKYKATGEIYTEPSDDLLHAHNPELQSYYDKIIKAAGLEEDLDKFPKQKAATDIVGSVTETAATELGVMPGIPVLGGFGDLCAITIGTGCCTTGRVHMYLGTSSWLVDILENRRADYAPEYFTFDAGHEGGMFGLETGAFAYDWVLDQLYHAERLQMGSKIFDFVQNELKDIPAGSDDLIATHWLTGEIPPIGTLNAKGLYFNLKATHDRRHMTKAMLEALAYSHRKYVEMYEDKNGHSLDTIRVVGGGAQNAVLMQIMADVTGKKIEVPENPRYTGTMGAYYCAMVGLGEIKNYAAVYDAVKIKSTYLPNAENTAVYDKLYNIYHKLHPALHELFCEINGDF